ncbi:unnamed protein product [Arabidopsis thaliana]|uniref:Uncharacterized protein n=1 Tax=Arabidopsis thaliana TaxID=3702 RepID=A0A654FI41_ARATH|nr:unnamed protein product [Arabidopsis thaliana]
MLWWGYPWGIEAMVRFRWLCYPVGDGSCRSRWVWWLEAPSMAACRCSCAARCVFLVRHSYFV